MLTLNPDRQIIDIKAPEWSATLEGPNDDHRNRMVLALPTLRRGDTVALFVGGRLVELASGVSGLHRGAVTLSVPRLRHGESLNLMVRGRDCLIAGLNHDHLGFDADQDVIFERRGRKVREFPAAG